MTPGESPRDPEIPASNPSVLSVVGSTYEQTRGCYSNQGIVAAPGGNGVNLTTRTMEAGKSLATEAGDAATCVVPGRLDSSEFGRLDSSDAYWCESGNENDCLIGFAYGVDEKTGKPGFQYVYWVGTSFVAAGQRHSGAHAGQRHETWRRVGDSSDRRRSRGRTERLPGQRYHQHYQPGAVRLKGCLKSHRLRLRKSPGQRYVLVPANTGWS